MGIAAKPTAFNGVQYRSVLEAKWAAYLQLLKVGDITYEPTQYGNRHWLPDFAITRGKSLLLCEVKPFSSLDDFISVRNRGGDTVIEKIVASYRHSVSKQSPVALLLPEQPLVTINNGMSQLVIGWLASAPALSEALDSITPTLAIQEVCRPGYIQSSTEGRWVSATHEQAEDGPMGLAVWRFISGDFADEFFHRNATDHVGFSTDSHSAAQSLIAADRRVSYEGGLPLKNLNPTA